ncbi:uncharacterized protein F5891DRAFT_955812, partial [Suillus fuscotomentosus]
NILCAVNVQHDCITSDSSCNIQYTREKQEHAETTKTKCVTQHTANNAYVLNTHSLHNYSLISAVIPPEIHVQMASPQIPNH